MASPGPPPVKTGTPVSARNPCRRLSPSAPTIHTIGFELSSSVVMIGAPRPVIAPHHAGEIFGAGCASILSTVRPPPAAPLGQLVPEPSKATYEPLSVGNTAGEVRI